MTAIVNTESINTPHHIVINFDNDKRMENSGVTNYLNIWAYKQQRKELFSVTLDTSAVTEIDYIVGARNAMTIAKFIKKMKKQPIQYIKYTIIVLNNNLLIGLLEMIFKMTKPCAAVYIVSDIKQANALHNVLSINNPFEINAYLLVHEISYVKPK